MLLRDEVIERAVKGSLDLWITFCWLVPGEIAHRVVAADGNPFSVCKDERFWTRAVANDQARPVFIRFLDVSLEFLVEQVVGLLVVLQDELASDDLEPLRANRREPVDAGGV